MPLPERPDLVLIDGSSYLYRAFFALPPLTNSRGAPTGAVLGVLNMLSKFLRDFTPPHIGVVFDAPGKTFRDELFAEYKAQRPPMPDDLRSQTEPLLSAVEALGLPVLRVDGVEADDVIGTLACRAAAAGQSVLISTGDKDMAQLVNEHITLINTMSGTVLDRAGVKTKFDVFPEQIIDYLALVGDSSDNIPGIDKVGPKTAAKWLNAYGTIDGLLEHAAEITGKVGENLRAGLTMLALSRQLATIRTDLDLPLDTAGLTRRAVDTAQLRAIYAALELRTLLSQLEGSTSATTVTTTVSEGTAGGEAGATTVAVEVTLAVPDDPEAAALAAIPRQYETIVDQESLDRWCQALGNAEIFAFDTETTSLDYMNTQIVGVSFCIEPGVAAYVPLGHDYAGVPPQLNRARVLEQFEAAARKIPDRAKLGQHLKFDIHVLENYGITLRGQRYDTMLESYVLDSTATRHDMDSMAKHYLGIDTIHFEDVAGKGAKQIGFNQVSVERAAEYSAEDADRHAAPAAPRTAVAAARAHACARRALHRRRTAAGAHPATHGAPRRSHRSRDAAYPERRAPGAAAWKRSRRWCTPKPAPCSISNHPSNCSRFCSRSCSCRCCARRPRARPRPRKDVLEELAENASAAAPDSRIPRPRQTALDLHREASRKHR